MDILAARDQENFAHSFQAGAASKALNAGLKGFNAKTPGNKAPKTPFRISRNDENAIGRGGKSALQNKGKVTENVFTIKKGDGKMDNNTFVTPAGARTRAPLGMKTTNAKAQAFQTPAATSTTVKPQKISPRLRRPKVKVHQAETEKEEGDDVPEIEHMPPKEVPLLDDMDDYLPRDWKFPMFEGENATRGIWETYHNPLEKDGRTRLQREFEEEHDRDCQKRDEEFDKLFNAQFEKDLADVHRRFGYSAKPVSKSQDTLIDPKKIDGPTSTQARSAVAALSDITQPNFATPTIAARSRMPALATVKKFPQNSSSSFTANHMPSTSAAKSTIGFARGRAVAASARPRQPISNITKPPLNGANAQRSASANAMQKRHMKTSSLSTMSRNKGLFSNACVTDVDTTFTATAAKQIYDDELDRKMKLLFLQDSDDEEIDAWSRSFSGQLDNHAIFDEALEDFELPLPEGS